MGLLKGSKLGESKLSFQTRNQKIPICNVGLHAINTFAFGTLLTGIFNHRSLGNRPDYSLPNTCL